MDYTLRVYKNCQEGYLQTSGDFGESQQKKITVSRGDSEYRKRGKTVWQPGQSRAAPTSELAALPLGKGLANHPTKPVRLLYVDPAHTHYRKGTV